MYGASQLHACRLCGAKYLRYVVVTMHKLHNSKEKQETVETISVPFLIRHLSHEENDDI